MIKLPLFNNTSSFRTKFSFSHIPEFCKKVSDEMLVYTGTIISYVEKKIENRFANKRLFLYGVVFIVSITTWITFFLMSDKAQTNQEEKTYQFKQSKPSLFPLADYYLFENKINVDKTDLIVKPNFKLENGTVKKTLLKDLDITHHLFIKEDRVIKKEMSKLNQ